MGEVVVSSEGGMELMDVLETEVEEEGQEEAAEKKKKASLEQKKSSNATGDGGGSSSVAATVKWERFLPKMVVRVLLVEADDSTRQIIAALLRKCSYRVAAVSDGLKAWEVLKGRPHNIDLILTEVELPSISGYALLTLIMEHEVCKNIPVIMMSSQDSVSTVYKCMLRGAADFLVKPVRKNELRNLWQHVWRKQSSSTGAGLGPPDESVAQQKVEATAENNATSNRSSGYAACVQKNRECIDKGSDAQSSCTKPDLETEGADTEHAHGPTEPKDAKSLSDDMNIPAQEECNETTKMGENEDEARESQAVSCAEVNYESTQGQDKNSDNGWEQANAIGSNEENNNVHENSSREAIDLIGAFDNYLKGNFGGSGTHASANKFDIFPLLDLSLRRSNPSGSVNQVNDERQRLNHSDASAFSRYVNKQPLPRNSTSPSTCNQQKDQETFSEKQQSNHPDYNSDTHGPTISPHKHVSVTTVQPGPSEITFSYPQHQKEISLPIPVRGVRFDNVINSYSSVIPQMYCSQSGGLHSRGTAHQSESFPQLNPFYQSDRQPSSSQQFHSLMEQRISGAIDQTDNIQGQKVENVEDRGHLSSANDQSGNRSYCNGSMSHHHSLGSGSNGMISNIPLVNATSDCRDEEGFHAHERASHRSMQREAALNKFRLKRKDRCFEKKVRYESRKKLAEQRPRVKGQFVRQLPNDPQSGNSSAG